MNAADTTHSQRPTMNPLQNEAAAIDGAAALVAVTMPLWVQYVIVWAQALIVLGGVVLLGLRIAIAWRDLRAQGRRGE
jgi:hypothetical protein